MASIAKRPDGQWRARYRDASGKEHSRHFPRKIDGQKWLDSVTASVVAGTYVDPAMARITMRDWAARWLAGYGVNRPSTVRAAVWHLSVICEAFGDRPLGTIRPSDVRSWTTVLSRTYAPATTYAIYRRLSQVMADAVHDGILPRNPCSRRTSPGQAKQRPYVATTEQVWQLHDAMPSHLRPAVLLGAFAGLRVAEAAALRTSDVDFLRGAVKPAVQYPDLPLKSETSRLPVPIPQELVLMLSASVAEFGGSMIVTDAAGMPSSPWAIERGIRHYRGQVDGLPEGFRFHDLRHYFASLLIAAGLDVKVVQARLRHASATTTLNTYGHMFPDRDESARAAVAAAIAARAGSADSVRTQGVVNTR